MLTGATTATSPETGTHDVTLCSHDILGHEYLLAVDTHSKPVPERGA